MVTPAFLPESANKLRSELLIGSANEMWAAIPSPKNVWVAPKLVRS